MEFISLHSIFLVIFFLIFYFVWVAYYRLYLSPIAKFPGPKLAALTFWYELYHDVIRPGQYTWEIARMHEQYGPIVRINPYEIHINDPDFIDQVYAGSSTRKTDKWDWAVRMFTSGDAAVSTLSHDLHRQRRSAIAPFFSKAAVQRLEPNVQSVVDKLVLRLKGLQGSGTFIDLVNFFTALTADVVFQYSFARSANLMEQPDFASDWHKVIKQTSINFHFMKHFVWAEYLMRVMPVWLIRLINPRAIIFLELENVITPIRHVPSFVGANTKSQDLYDQVSRIQQDLKEDGKPSGQKTIFYDVLTSDVVRPENKTTQHLVNEARILVIAATVSTTHILAVLTFHVVDNPNILKRLQAELATLTKEGQSWRHLEKLPFLTAVISESLRQDNCSHQIEKHKVGHTPDLTEPQPRMGYGTSHRLQRISPDVALQYKEWSIPAGTPVSMTAILIHDNPTIFPSPRTFIPDRWLDLDGNSNNHLQKYIMPFSRGARNCVGMNLAYAEMYLTVAAMFTPGRFRFELFETDASDVETVHDWFNPFPRQDSKGIRLLVN